jgi:site-specific DNA-methyltransferase (adenine-specific)
VNDALYSSAKGDWATPQWLFEILDREFGFGLDAAASVENAKCSKFFVESDDALNKSWVIWNEKDCSNETIWLNPPYGRGIGLWMQKAYESSLNGAMVVCLVPARTDTSWFHDWVFDKAAEVRFLKGRLKFGNAENSAPFPSCLVVYSYNKSSNMFNDPTEYKAWDPKNQYRKEI